MKINDVKLLRRVDEKFSLDQLVGDYGAAALRQIGNRVRGNPVGQASVQQRQIQDLFINNLVGDAILNVTQGIENGMIDPNLSKGQPATAPVDPATVTQTQPAQAQPAASTQGRDPDAGAKAKGSYDAQKQTSQNINNYVRKVSGDLNATKDPRQKMALTKEIVNFMADRKNYPEWENAVTTVQQIIRKNNQSDFANAAINRLKSGQVMAEAWQIYWINKLLENVGITWNQLGLSVLKENKQKFYIVETKYYKLNKLFENILNEAVSVGEFLKTRWLPAYAQKKGIDISGDAQDIDRIITDIDNTWEKDQGKTSLRKLGSLMFTLRNTVPGRGGSVASPGQQGVAGQSTSTVGTGQSAQPASATNSSGAPVTSSQMASIIEKYAEKLKATDAAKYNELMGKLLEKYRMWDQLKR